MFYTHDCCLMPIGTHTVKYRPTNREIKVMVQHIATCWPLHQIAKNSKLQQVVIYTSDTAEMRAAENKNIHATQK